MDKNLPSNARDPGSIPGPGRSHMPQGNKAHVTQLGKPSMSCNDELLQHDEDPTQPQLLKMKIRRNHLGVSRKIKHTLNI